METLGGSEPLPAAMPQLLYTRLGSLMRFCDYPDRLAPFFNHFPAEKCVHVLAWSSTLDLMDKIALQYLEAVQVCIMGIADPRSRFCQLSHFAQQAFHSWLPSQWLVHHALKAGQPVS